MFCSIIQVNHGSIRNISLFHDFSIEPYVFPPCLDDFPQGFPDLLWRPGRHGIGSAQDHLWSCHLIARYVAVGELSYLQCGAPKRHKLICNPHEYSYKYHKSQLLELCSPTERYRLAPHCRHLHFWLFNIAMEKSTLLIGKPSISMGHFPWLCQITRGYWQIV